MQEKILIIQTAFLGDAVLTLPMIQKLKEKFPASILKVLCILSTKELFEHSPSVDETIVYDKRGEQKSFLSYIKLIKQINEQKFTQIYSPHRSFRSSILVMFSGVKNSSGFDIASCSFFYKRRIKYFSSKHEVARNLDLIGYDTSGEKWKVLPFINTGSAAEIKIGEIIENLGKKRFAAVAPGSVWSTKIYPQEYFLDAINYLVNQNYDVYLVGGSADKRLCNNLANNYKAGVHSLAGKLTVIESIALLKKCALLISNDSAPTHLGMIADIPTITIYCSTVPEFGFYPYNRKSKSLSLDGLDCKPCGIHGHMECPIKTFDCGKKLLPDVLIASIKEFILH
ncbi:MAG: glycosyltransferase family 9 protein [Ignavibacteriales bacterium]|nr:glycosyltransferase family 9 protein [Ignavibacteriales bacterium]